MEKWDSLTKEQQVEVNRQLELIRRGTVEIVPEDALQVKVIHSVLTGKPLRKTLSD